MDHCPCYWDLWYKNCHPNILDTFWYFRPNIIYIIISIFVFIIWNEFRNMKLCICNLTKYGIIYVLIFYHTDVLIWNKSCFKCFWWKQGSKHHYNFLDNYYILELNLDIKTKLMFCNLGLGFGIVHTISNIKVKYNVTLLSHIYSNTPDITTCNNK